MNKLLFMILFFVLVVSCAPAPAAPTSTPTATILPTRTPRPTQTAVPTAITSHSLQTEGPYVLLSRQSDLTMIDMDGTVRKQIQLSNDGYTIELDQAVSPDGILLAYFTGSPDEPYDLALNLFNLSDETFQTIATIIAPGFPENLRPVAETLNLSDYNPYSCNNVECLARLSSNDFVLGITSFAWSPDGQYLAFAAQIDGPSSDIYLYDRKTQEIRQLTDEIENIWSLQWSPSGEKILYRATVPGPVDPYIYSYVADPKINSPQSSRAIVQYYLAAQLGWIADNSFLYALMPNDYRQSIYGSLLATNLVNNETKEVWPYGAESIGLDLANNKFILSTKGTDNSDVTAGTYLVSLDRSFTKISDNTYKFFEDQELFKTFFGLDTNGQIYSISPDGDIRLLGQSLGYATPSISPDKKWFLIFENSNKIILYSDDFQFQKSWEFSEIIETYSIKWRTDSLGLIIPTNKMAYYLSIPNGEPQLEPELINIHSYNYVWLP